MPHLPRFSHAIILHFFHNLINPHDIRIYIYSISSQSSFFFPLLLEKLLGQDWTRCKCVLSICALHEWRNANAMSRVTHLGWSKSGTSCAFVALVANISLFFPSTDQPFTVDVELQPVEFQPERCARVMLTRALRIEALPACPPSYEAFGQVFHGITLFIDRPPPPLFILHSQIPLIPRGEKIAFKAVEPCFPRKVIFRGQEFVYSTIFNYLFERNFSLRSSIKLKKWRMK